MEVSFYLPITEVLIGVGIYLVIGILLYVPMVIWSSTFISGSPWKHRVLNKEVFISFVAWPFILITLIRYQMKGK